MTHPAALNNNLIIKIIYEIENYFTTSPIISGNIYLYIAKKQKKCKKFNDNFFRFPNSRVYLADEDVEDYFTYNLKGQSPKHTRRDF